jgi:hypothetical protein
MIQDDFGNEIAQAQAGSMGDVDLEYVYPPKSERMICALDERFDAQDAVANDHERRIAHLEALVHRLANESPLDLTIARAQGYAAGVTYGKAHYANERIAHLETQVHRLLNTEPVQTNKVSVTLTRDEWHYLRKVCNAQEIYNQIFVAMNTPAAAHPPEADYAHIPAAEWEAICAELEGLRKFKANDSGERFISGDEWAGMYAQLKALRAFKASVPWAGLKKIDWADETRAWFSANAPEEATE